MELPLPENEVARLDILRQFRILDTPPEQVFDDLTRLTAYICGTPIAYIGFMDSDRLWLKSRIGWDVREVPREMSFCAHTILQSDVLVVSDTLADEGRLALCPLATHGGVRFYAGASLMCSQGYALGTLCVMDTIPRGLTPGQIDSLRRLARLVANLVQTRWAVSNSTATVLPDQPAGGGDLSRDSQPHSERPLQSIIASAMDAIITVDSRQRIVVFNKAAEQIFRCHASEALGKPLDKFIPQRFRSIHRQHIQGFAKTGVTGRTMESPGTLFALRADGEEFPIEATISQVETDGKKFFTVILRDIGARLRMEAELRHAQKMEAVGQLAGGIAHEFNNFLGVILGYSELLWEEAAENEKLRRHVTEVKTATQHAASLTRQLLAFSRKQPVDAKVVDLNQTIWECHKLLRRLVPANIDVVPVLSPEVERVKVEPGQLQQILINLLVNARDAMPHGGKVLIETANLELDEASASHCVGLESGSYVLLSIKDSGAGMAAEIRSHLFEPFYTTKEPGKGTGLGLSTVYGIVKRSGGHISVESAEGKGTTFQIYLPRVCESAPEPETVITRTLHPTGSATILVVEDETALRRLLLISLEKHNYKVLAARDGAEAVEIFRRHADEIQLIVTDLMMPRMDGFELKRQIADLRRDVKFLFMSGYAEQIMEEHHRSLDGCAFLEKPFLPEELVNQVNVLLAGDAAA